jgi:hypothetical protein
MKIIRTDSKHPYSPESFNFYLRHHFIDGTWIAIHKQRPYGYRDLRVELSIKGDDTLAPRTWIDWGCPDPEGEVGNDLIDGFSNKDESAAWTIFHTYVQRILNEESAITAEEDGYEEGSYDAVFIEL